MFAASLNTLKQRTSQLLKGEDGPKSTSFEAQAREPVFIPPQALGYTADSLLVQYEVQNSKDRDMAIFVLPLGEDVSVTGGLVRQHFPFPGRHHFRYKAPTSDGSFGGYVWIDLASDLNFVPVYFGSIVMKVLELPADADTKRHPAPTYSMASASQQAVSSRAPSETSLSRPASSPDDLMQLDLGSSGYSRAYAGGSPSASSPASSPSPVKLDRQQLVAEREAREKAAVDEKMRRHIEQKKREDTERKQKVELANQLQKELEDWARMPDGQSYKDIRTLLSTMHTVMWPDSGWEPLPLSELVAGDSKIKKYYRQAIMMAHPDKNKGATVEQQVRADRIFNALNEAFKLST